MLTGFDGSGMIPILPKGPLALFPLVIFLPGSACQQLNGFGYRFTVVFSMHDQVDVLCEAPHYVKLILHPLEIITIFKSSTRYHST